MTAWMCPVKCMSAFGAPERNVSIGGFSEIIYSINIFKFCITIFNQCQYEIEILLGLQLVVSFDALRSKSTETLAPP